MIRSKNREKKNDDAVKHFLRSVEPFPKPT